MRATEQDFAVSYRNLSEAEIAALYEEIGTLTDAARSALAAEIERRGLAVAHLKKLHAAETRREALFDRRETKHRKDLAGYLLSRSDPRGLVIILIAGLVFVAIAALIAHRH